MKKTKKIKEKKPLLIKFIWNLQLLIGLTISIAGYALAAVLGLFSSKLDSQWGLWCLNVLDIVIIFMGAIFIIAAILRGQSKRGKAMYGEASLAK